MKYDSACTLLLNVLYSNICTVGGKVSPKNYPSIQTNSVNMKVGNMMCPYVGTVGYTFINTEFYLSRDLNAK